MRRRNESVTQEQRDFLDKTYLGVPYIVPADVHEVLHSATEYLLDTDDSFIGLVNVGSTANGSLEFRRRFGGKKASDLDFYVIGTNDTPDALKHAADAVERRAKEIGLEIDPGLNGRSVDNFLNLDELDDHIDREEFDLLALPFRSMFGRVKFAREAVLAGILDQDDDSQAIWDEVADYHAQSLSMHHGTFSEGLSSLIMNRYYPVKVTKFGLPDTPEAALEALETRHA